jgi:hypothetical protein
MKSAWGHTGRQKGHAEQFVLRPDWSAKPNRLVAKAVPGPEDLNFPRRTFVAKKQKRRKGRYLRMQKGGDIHVRHRLNFGLLSSGMRL